MIGFQIFQTISCGELLAQNNISQKLMLLENDKIDIRHCLALGIKFGSVIFERKCANTAMVVPPVIGSSILCFLFLLLLKSKLVNLHFALNHFSKQSAANFN